MFPPRKAQVKLTDDPRTPVTLFPLKDEVNCSPHTAQGKIVSDSQKVLNPKDKK